MAGINQGRPETAIGEPIRFGDDLDFEIEQHPISDRLIIRDTANGKEAYVRADRGGSIGGDGVLIKALKEGKPVADDGRTHDTIQQAERAASSFVFVPPGTFNENVTIDTEGLTLRGSGHNTFIDGGASSNAISVNADNVTLSHLSASTDRDGQNNITNPVAIKGVDANNVSAISVTIRDSGGFSGILFGDDVLMNNCRVEQCAGKGLVGGTRAIFNSCIVRNVGQGTDRTFSDSIRGVGSSITANCIVDSNTSEDGIQPAGDNNIVIGCRIMNIDNEGLQVNGNDNILANNRVSDSGGSDISDAGAGNLLDGNLTGPSN
jgi:hypothetical protein